MLVPEPELVQELALESVPRRIQQRPLVTRLVQLELEQESRRIQYLKDPVTRLTRRGQVQEPMVIPLQEQGQELERLVAEESMAILMV